MELFGFALPAIPLWALFIIGILLLMILWKLIKFALKILLVLVVVFLIMIGLDLSGVLTWIQQNVISLFL